MAARMTRAVRGPQRGPARDGVPAGPRCRVRRATPWRAAVPPPTSPCTGSGRGPSRCRALLRSWASSASWCRRSRRTSHPAIEMAGGWRRSTGGRAMRRRPRSRALPCVLGRRRGRARVVHDAEATCAPRAVMQRIGMTHDPGRRPCPPSGSACRHRRASAPRPQRSGPSGR